MNAAAGNERQSIKLDPRVSGGTFSLIGPGGKRTPPIAITAAAADVEAALLPVLGAGNVAVSGAAKAWLVEFTGARANTAQPLLRADGTNLSGSVAAVYLSHETVGSDGTTALPVTPTAVTMPQATPVPMPQATPLPMPAATPAPPPVSEMAIKTSVSLPAFASGCGQVDTTARPLGEQAIPKHLVIRANGSNSSIISIGNSLDTAAEGYILGRGETTPPIFVDNLNKVFLVGSAPAQGYSWIAT